MDIEDKEAINKILDEMRKIIVPHIIVPEWNESAVVAIVTPKVASLFFDRVWSFTKIPESIQIYCGSTLEENIFTLANFGWMTEWSHENQTIEAVRQAIHDQSIEALQLQLAYIAKDLNFSYDYSGSLMEGIERAVTFAIYHEKGIFVPEFYSAQAHYERLYTPGDERLLIASLTNLDILNEEELEWEQILEFRKDYDARRKLQRLIHWLDKDLVDKTQAFIEDEISERLNDYNWSIKKHRLKTTVGAIRSIINHKTLLMSAGATIAAGFVSGGLAALVIGSGIMIGNCALSIAENMIEVADYQKNNAEIAFIHELKNRF